MDSLNGDSNCQDATEPHHVEVTGDKVAVSCSVSSGIERQHVDAIKRTGEKMNKQNSACLDSEHAQWLLAAVRRVRGQKQRPNIDRVMNTLRIICPGRFRSRESVTEELELAVSEGILLRVGAAGDNDSCSYRDPGRVVRLKSHALHVTRDLDMTKMVARSVRELADPAGSTLADLQRYIRSGYNVKIHDDSDLQSMIAKYCRRAVELGKLICKEDSGECRYQAAYTGPKNNKVNCTKTVSSPLASYSLVDRAFKTDVSELRLFWVMMHTCFFNCMFSVLFVILNYF